MSRNVVSDINTFNPISAFFKSGHEITNVDEVIREAFKDFFQSKTPFGNFPPQFFAAEWVNFEKFKLSTPSFREKISSCLEIYNAPDVKERAIQIIARNQGDWGEINYRFWTFYKVQNVSDEQPFDELVENTFSLIGKSIEGLIKFYLKEIYEVKYGDETGRSNRSLGSIIDHLLKDQNLPELLVLRGEKLNTWRNIAYHHQFKIIKNKIKCWRSKNDVEGIELSVEDLKSLLSDICYRAVNTFILARAIFCIDNIAEIAQTVPNKNSELLHSEIRSETRLLSLAATLSTQGFEVIRLEEDEKRISLSVQDLTDKEVRMRAIHATQFLYGLFYYFPTGSEYFIEYVSKNNLPYLKAKIGVSVLEKIGKGEVGLDYLAKNVEINLLHNEA